ncbi:MAG: hypothetical protein LH603_20520 [Pseudonocardia sp.]|nr:hypothetical protein [Pseudonocardia sp.]
MVQRGTCTFEIKATNAVAAGAGGVIVFNEGQPGRTDAVAGTLGVPGFTIPVVGVSFDIGVALQNTSVRLTVSGAEGIKTPEQAARYGGTAGAAYDPNYHQVGDRFDNVSLEVLDQNADAIAFSTLTFARCLDSINR